MVNTLDLGNLEFLVFILAKFNIGCSIMGCLPGMACLNFVTDVNIAVAINC